MQLRIFVCDVFSRLTNVVDSRPKQANGAAARVGLRQQPDGALLDVVGVARRRARVAARDRAEVLVAHFDRQRARSRGP